MGENAVLVRLFEHNLWANERMIRACAGLTEAQLAVETTGTYGALGRTIIHLARAQGGYLRTLTGWEPGAEHQLEYETLFAGVDRVAWHLDFTGRRLVDVARTASAERIVERHRNGESFRLPEWVVLLQAAYHATEHRQQVATTLTTLGVEPPEPDLWAFWDTIGTADA